jgi:uncharacterized membrane-anchored protein
VPRGALRVPEITVYFWVAYVITRPLGASFADWVGKPASVSGLGLGNGRLSLVLTVMIACLVAYLAVTRRDVQRQEVQRGPAARAPGA